MQLRCIISFVGVFHDTRTTHNLRLFFQWSTRHNCLLAMFLPLFFYTGVMVLLISGHPGINLVSIAAPLMLFGVFNTACTRSPCLYEYLRSVYNMRSLNQFGCCTLKPNTFPMRSTGRVSNVIRFTHVHSRCNVLEWYIHTCKRRKKKKKQQKRIHKNLYMYSAGYDVNGTMLKKNELFERKL